MLNVNVLQAGLRVILHCCVDIALCVSLRPFLPFSSSFFALSQSPFQRGETINSNYNKVVTSLISLHVLWFQGSTRYFPVLNWLGTMFNSPCLSIHATQKAWFSITPCTVYQQWPFFLHCSFTASTDAHGA